MKDGGTAHARGDVDASTYHSIVPDYSPEKTIAALEEVWTATGQMLGELHPDAWDLATDCPGWTVRDHVSHMIGTELGLLGTASPPPPEPMPKHVHNPIGQSNEAWVEARRHLPGTEVLAEFVEVTARRLEELRSMTAERWAQPGWSPIGEAPYAEFMQIRIMDCWVHEQDIRWAVDRPGDRGGRGERVSLGRLTAAMGFVVGRQVAPEDGTTVVFDLSGPLPTVLAVGMDGKRASELPSPPAEPSVRITLPAEHFVRLTCGRENSEAALASGEVALAADEELGRRVLGAMNIMV